jgi:hypothetical protein
LISILLFLILNRQKTPLLKAALKKLKPSIMAIIMVFFIILFSYFFVINYSKDALSIYLNRVDSCITGYSMMFIAGIYFDYGNSKTTKKIILFFWFLFSVFILYNTDLLISSYFIYEEMPDKIANYIFITNGYVFFSIFTITYVKNNFIKILIWVIIVVLLFLVPSRSNTLGFILATLVPIFIYRKFVYSIIIVVLLWGVGSYIMVSYENNTLIKNSRLLSTNLVDDTSLKQRKEQANKNFENLKSTWFLGDFMGDIRIFGEDGNETHSYLSFWEQFGLIPFLLLIWSMGILIYYLFILRNTDSLVYLSTLMLFLYIVPLMFFAKGFSSSLIWFVIPRIVMYNYSLKKGY